MCEASTVSMATAAAASVSTTTTTTSGNHVYGGLWTSSMVLHPLFKDIS
jgi:hypothetical protein